MEKIKKVKLPTSKGDRYIMMRPVLDEMEDGETYCVTHCPYGVQVCKRIRDPRHPEDKDGCFADFCSDLGLNDGEDSKLVNYIPVEGEIERALSDFPDVIQELQKENPLVKLNDVIDHMCSDACDMYNKEHSNCSSENKLCVLRGLLKNRDFGKKSTRKNR